MQKDQDKIRGRAYEIWDQNGRQSGRDEEYWLQAERELSASAIPAPAAMADNLASPAGRDETIAPALATPAASKKKANGAAKAVAAKAAAPRKRRGSDPVTQA